VLEAVQVSVNPKVIETPPVSAVAKDGIQVRAIARVTVRANIERLVGGAGEEKIRIASPRWCWQRGWILERLSKFSLSILQM